MVLTIFIIIVLVVGFVVAMAFADHFDEQERRDIAGLPQRASQRKQIEIRVILAWPFKTLGSGLFICSIFLLALASRLSGVDYVKSLFLEIEDEVQR